MRFEALSLDDGRTFVHASYTFSDSAALCLAAKIYFVTLGWNKAGFTANAAPIGPEDLDLKKATVTIS